MPSALLLVENNSVPADTRVWAECTSLRRAGWDVTVISPKGRNRDVEAYRELDGVQIHRFDLAPSGRGVGYVREYGLALLRMSAIVRRLSRRQRFDVVHACNPPDFLLLAAIALRRRGAAMIFDHHDLSPELSAAKYGRAGRGPRALKLTERQASPSPTSCWRPTNRSGRSRSNAAARMPGDVFVVRNGPDTDVFKPTEPDPDCETAPSTSSATSVSCGSQDGVDVALEALADAAPREGDWRAVFVGDGDALARREGAFAPPRSGRRRLVHGISSVTGTAS